MRITRREGLRAAAVAAAARVVTAQEKRAMYGLINRLKAATGKRDELAAILIEASRGMAGCRSYVVAKDVADADALWVTEVWDTEAAHTASLGLPAVKAAIAKGRPLIASFDERHITEPFS